MVSNMKYAKQFIYQLGMGYPMTHFYHFIYNKLDANGRYILIYFAMHGVGICVELENFVANIFYERSFSHVTAFPVALNEEHICLSLESFTMKIFHREGGTWGRCV